MRYCGCIIKNIFRKNINLLWVILYFVMDSFLYNWNNTFPASHSVNQIGS